MMWIKMRRTMRMRPSLRMSQWGGKAGIQWIEDICRVLDALTILISKVSTVIDPLLSRKGLQQSCVELIHIHIARQRMDLSRKYWSKWPGSMSG